MKSKIRIAMDEKKEMGKKWLAETEKQLADINKAIKEHRAAMRAKKKVSKGDKMLLTDMTTLRKELERRKVFYEGVIAGMAIMESAVVESTLADGIWWRGGRF